MLLICILEHGTGLLSEKASGSASKDMDIDLAAAAEEIGKRF